MAWNLEGTYFESCSCDVSCPCMISMSLGADLDYCRIVLVFNLQAGDVEGVDVGGTKVAMIVETPKDMTQGNWRIGLIIGDTASDEQTQALGRVFSGELGGPPGALGPLLGEFLGVERAAFEISENGLTHRAKIGDVVDMEVEDIVPFGVDSGEPVRLMGAFHPAGSAFNFSKSNRAQGSPFGIDFQGRSGFSNPEFAWAG